MLSDELRNFKPYAIPVRVVKYKSITDAKARELKEELRNAMKECGMTTVGMCHIYKLLDFMHIRKSTDVHLNQKRLLLSIGVWSLITHSAFLGKNSAWRRCVCDSCHGSQYAHIILPRSKMACFVVCVEPRAISRRGYRCNE